MLWQSSHFYNENPHTMKDGLYIDTGPMSCLSIKILYYQWKNSYNRNNMVWWPSYVYNGKPYNQERWSLYCTQVSNGFLQTGGCQFEGHYKVWDDTTYPFPDFNSAAVEAWEWIDNSIPHFAEHVITYPWRY